METVLYPGRELIVSVEDASLLNNVRQAIKMLRGVSSVRVNKINNTITPAIKKTIQDARTEFQNGETIVCNTKEDMQRYFDSL